MSAFQVPLCQFRVYKNSIFRNFSSSFSKEMRVAAKSTSIIKSSINIFLSSADDSSNLTYTSPYQHLKLHHSLAIFSNGRFPESSVLKIKQKANRPFLVILQMSDGSIFETSGTQLVKSHLRSTTKSPSAVKDASISGFRVLIWSRDWCFSLRRSAEIVCRSPQLEFQFKKVKKSF